MVLGVKFSDIVPYTSVFLDCSFSDILFGIEKCTNFLGNQDDGREEVKEEIENFFVSEKNENFAIVCLSARTAFDLYLRVCAFPVDSEIIFSAINIPDMAFIAQKHGLRIVPCDLDLSTLGPRVDLIEELVTARTVAILVAHLFGRWTDIEAILEIAERKNLKIIEDCAESFCGFEFLGNPKSDLILFSFGPIKFFTAFGGGVAKVKNWTIFDTMRKLHDFYEIQETNFFLAKLIKCAFVFCLLDIPSIIKPGMFLTDRLNINHKRLVVQMLRGFPTDLIRRLRHRPPTALLQLLLRRFRSFDSTTFWKYSVNGQYIWDRLPPEMLKFGEGAIRNNFWLFPVLVNDPLIVAQELNRNGIDAYIGASQLSVVEPEFVVFEKNKNASHASATEKFHISPFPTTAKFFMDHVIYLPVNRTVSNEYLEKILVGLRSVVSSVCRAPPQLPANVTSQFSPNATKATPQLPANTVVSNFLKAKL